MSPLVPYGKAKKEKSSLRSTNQNPVDGRQKVISALPSPVKSPGVILSAELPNCVASTDPFELRLIHHSAGGGRKIPMSVFPSPSKSNGASGVTTDEPPPQNPLARENVPPVDVVPAID